MNNTTINMEVAEGPIHSPELFVSMLQEVDGWTTKPSDFFEGGIKIEKTRKRNDPISIHYIPEEGRFRKIAEEALYSPKIEREFKFWQNAMEHFGVNKVVSLSHLSRLKSDPSRGYQKLAYIDMPYMGLPLHHMERILPGTIPEESRNIFLERMKLLVTEKRIFHPDMNPGNILVQVTDGTPKLFPIDWESANPRVPEDKVEYYANEELKRCRDALSEYYPAEGIAA